MSVPRVPRWIAQSIVGIGLVVSLGSVFGASAPDSQGAAQAPAAAVAKDECPAGFSGSPEKGCVDVNECATYNGGCSRLAMCVNTPGSRTCGSCPQDFAGNGYVGCFDANECPNGDCTSRLPVGAEDALPPVITTSGNVTVPATIRRWSRGKIHGIGARQARRRPAGLLHAGLRRGISGWKNDRQLLGVEQPGQAEEHDADRNRHEIATSFQLPASRSKLL